MNFLNSTDFINSRPFIRQFFKCEFLFLFTDICFAGTVLKNDGTLADAGIRENFMLHVIEKKRGNNCSSSLYPKVAVLLILVKVNYCHRSLFVINVFIYLNEMCYIIDGKEIVPEFPESDIKKLRNMLRFLQKKHVINHVFKVSIFIFVCGTDVHTCMRVYI